MKILEKLWYGNIEPTEYDTSACREYKQLLEQVCRKEEILQATLGEEQKALFIQYTDSVNQYHAITDCMLFQNSFRLGVRMMLEVMEE